MNIEKEFYKIIEEKYGDCKSVAFHLTEKCGLSAMIMERYLIRNDFEVMVTAKKYPKMEIYAMLGEKYSKSIDAIIYIIKKL